MQLATDILENLFKSFAGFSEKKDGEPFRSFNSSRYFDREEKYKEKIYQEARETIKNGRWKPEDIGTGKIHQTVCDAIKTKVIHRYQSYDNNLINHWTIIDSFARSRPSRHFEQLLFDFYKSKGIPNEVVFNALISSGHPYNLVAFLFFIKDGKTFLPISQQRFDKIFEIIGMPDFRTSGRASWENYEVFLSTVKQVRDFLRTKDKNATLLDAHSFLWVSGNQMQRKIASKQPLLESTIQTPAEKPVEIQSETVLSEPPFFIAEEDEELTFPEGREVLRLHKLKERNRELVKAAKEARLRIDANLCCDACGFSFTDTYGELGHGFIEAHHISPVSQLRAETQAKIGDLALVCSNCHRMLHRRRPWLTIDELKRVLANGVKEV